MVRNGWFWLKTTQVIIPYTPISLAVIIAVLLLPVLMRYTKKYALATATLISLLVFFVSELLLENMVIITDNVTTTLESWQMFMCYVPRRVLGQGHGNRLMC